MTLGSSGKELWISKLPNSGEVSKFNTSQHGFLIIDASGFLMKLCIAPGNGNEAIQISLEKVVDNFLFSVDCKLQDLGKRSGSGLEFVFVAVDNYAMHSRERNLVTQHRTRDHGSASSASASASASALDDPKLVELHAALTAPGAPHDTIKGIKFTTTQFTQLMKMRGFKAFLVGFIKQRIICDSELHSDKFKEHYFERWTMHRPRFMFRLISDTISDDETLSNGCLVELVYGGRVLANSKALDGLCNVATREADNVVVSVIDMLARSQKRTGSLCVYSGDGDIAKATLQMSAIWQSQSHLFKCMTPEQQRQHLQEHKGNGPVSVASQMYYSIPSLYDGACCSIKTNFTQLLRMASGLLEFNKGSSVPWSEHQRRHFMTNFPHVFAFFINMSESDFGKGVPQITPKTWYDAMILYMTNDGVDRDLIDPHEMGFLASYSKKIDPMDDQHHPSNLIDILSDGKNVRINGYRLLHLLGFAYKTKYCTNNKSKNKRRLIFNPNQAVAAPSGAKEVNVAKILPFMLRQIYATVYYAIKPILGHSSMPGFMTDPNMSGFVHTQDSIIPVDTVTDLRRFIGCEDQ